MSEMRFSLSPTPTHHTISISTLFQSIFPRLILHHSTAHNQAISPHLELKCPFNVASRSRVRKWERRKLPFDGLVYGEREKEPKHHTRCRSFFPSTKHKIIAAKNIQKENHNNKRRSRFNACGRMCPCSHRSYIVAFACRCRTNTNAQTNIFRTGHCAI